MIIKNDEMLKEFREGTRCEYCGKAAMQGCDPHHTFYKRGLGGGTRLDVRSNLSSVHRWCHSIIEDSRAADAKMKLIVSTREGSTVQCITDALRFLKMAPKKASVEWLEVAMQGLQPEPRRLARSALIEAGLLTGIG